jgi:hypothetical protein
MKKYNFYLLVYFIVIVAVACMVSCQPSKTVLKGDPCEHMVVKHKAYNPNHLLPYRH